MNKISLLVVTLLPTSVFAEGTQQEAGFATFIPLVVLMVVFYFLLIRPQTKKTKSHKKLLEELTKNDEIVTGGGTLGKIIKVGDSFVEVEVANDVIIKVQKQSIGQKMPKGTI